MRLRVLGMRGPEVPALEPGGGGGAVCLEADLGSGSQKETMGCLSTLLLIGGSSDKRASHGHEDLGLGS